MLAFRIRITRKIVQKNHFIFRTRFGNDTSFVLTNDVVLSLSCPMGLSGAYDHLVMALSFGRLEVFVRLYCGFGMFVLYSIVLCSVVLCCLVLL